MFDASELDDIVGPRHVITGEEISEDFGRDEALTVSPVQPLAVVRPGSTDEVAELVRWASAQKVPLTARGSGTGLSGACVPRSDGVVVTFNRMAEVVDVDTANHVAVVQPGVTLQHLDEVLRPRGLTYPVSPGEFSASVGGNVATNAGGMRAVRYGVTRHQVLGLTAVLGTGETITTGGRFVKATSGYDLTQLIIGSEGTLAIVTEAILRIHPRLNHRATALVPFPDLEHITDAIPRIVESGLTASILEYIDVRTMSAITTNAGLELGIPPAVKDGAEAYLVVVLEGRDAVRVEEDTAELAGLVEDLGAMDLYVLPSAAGAALVDAREKAFWAVKALGADDIIDVVVPRASMSDYFARVQDVAQVTGSLIMGCGHAGDGNVHLSVFQPDPDAREDAVGGVLSAGVALGGAVSGEHGIGTAKKRFLARIEDPAKLELMRRIKNAFDPAGILNPGTIFD